MLGTFDNLNVCHLTPESRAQTCGYWYVVRSGAMAPHAAFETRAALDGWLDITGLKVERDIEKRGRWSPLIGAIRYDLLMSHARLDAIEGRTFASLQNGDYTVYKAHDMDGARVLSCLNPNVRDRIKFVHKQARARIAAGNYSTDGLDRCE
jgi:hypothetical protein